MPGPGSTPPHFQAGRPPSPPSPRAVFIRVLCFRRFLASKEQFHAYLRAGGLPGSGQAGSRGEEEEEEVKEKKEEVGSCQSEPPAKRVRLEDLGQDGESQEDAGAEKEPAERKRARGQNKNRPCMKPNHYEQSRLCPSVSQVGCGGPALRCSGTGNLGPWWALPAQGQHYF